MIIIILVDQLFFVQLKIFFTTNTQYTEKTVKIFYSWCTSVVINTLNN